MENQDIKQLIGKCGFYCGSCPDYIKGDCSGCCTSHNRGDCYTFDCVVDQDLDFCGTCSKFPCNEIMTKDKATVLDTRWLKWRAAKRDASK